MRKFEYKIQSFDSGTHITERYLNKQGKKGWELSSATRGNEYPESVSLVFKRELPASGDDLAKELQK